MKPFDQAAVRQYVAGGEPRDKAGAYAVQGRGRRLVARVDGSLTNVIGLPVERLARMLAACGAAPGPGRKGVLDRVDGAAIVGRANVSQRRGRRHGEES
jgi:hypothetical protein